MKDAIPDRPSIGRPSIDRPSIDRPSIGRRNESSLLFSLANLGDLSTQSGTPCSATPGPAEAQRSADPASPEYSGLLDMLAIARSREQLRLREQQGAPLPSRIVPPQLGMIVPITMTASGTASRERERSLLTACAIVGASGMAAACILGVALVSRPSSIAHAAPRPERPTALPAAESDADADAEPEAHAHADADAEPEAHADADAARRPGSLAPRGLAGARATHLVGAVARGTSLPRSSLETSSLGHGSPSRGSRERGARASVDSAPARVAPRRANASQQQLEAMIARTLVATDPSPPVGAALGPTPSRQDVMGAMERARPAVASCGAVQHGRAVVTVTLAGATGRVTGATVAGELAGTPAAGCMMRAVRGVVVPRFSRSSFRVQYPFRI